MALSRPPQLATSGASPSDGLDCPDSSRAHGIACGRQHGGRPMGHGSLALAAKIRPDFSTMVAGRMVEHTTPADDYPLGGAGCDFNVLASGNGSIRFFGV